MHDLLNEQNDRREATESFVRGTAATLKRLLKAGGAVDTALEDELLGVAPPPTAAGAEGLPPTPSKVRRNKTGLGYDGGASAGGGAKEEDEEEEPVDMQTQMAMMMSMMTSGGGGGGGADAPAIVGPVSSASALKKDKLNLSGLLNVLDGVVDTPERIVVMTTNHPEILDPALIRPGRIDQKLLLGYMNARNVIEMIKHYFQLGDDGLDFDLAKRVREAIVGSDAKGVPALNLTPAQVEQLSAEHDDVQSMVEALEGKTHHATALAGSADEKGVAPPLEDGMIAPTKGASATVTFEEHSWRH